MRRLGFAWLATMAVGCRPPEHDRGITVAHPEDWDRDTVVIYDGTFSDDQRRIRIRTEPMHPHVLAVNLEYPTSGRDNRHIEGLIDEHSVWLLAHLARNPAARVTLVGFSQGGCLVLDLLARLQGQPDVLERLSVALVAPARGVRLGRHTTVAKHMIARCSRAEASLDAAIAAAPEGPAGRLLRERTWIAWSCTDEIVGHDTFTSLQGQVPQDHRLYRRRLRHLDWTGKDLDPSQDGEVYLATTIALSITQGIDPRVAIAPWGGFDGPCEP